MKIVIERKNKNRYKWLVKVVLSDQEMQRVIKKLKKILSKKFKSIKFILDFTHHIDNDFMIEFNDDADHAFFLLMISPHNELELDIE